MSQDIVYPVGPVSSPRIIQRVVEILGSPDRRISSLSSEHITSQLFVILDARAKWDALTPQIRQDIFLTALKEADLNLLARLKQYDLDLRMVGEPESPQNSLVIVFWTFSPYLPERRRNAMLWLIDNGADVNYGPAPYAVNALSLAIGRKNNEALKFLIEKGADVNYKRGRHGRTALQYAAFTGNLSAVQILLRNGAEVNAQGFEKGKTALRYAMQKGYLSIAQLLIEKGADINIKEYSQGKSELHFAAEKNDVTDIRLLLNGGADVNAEDKSGRTPLEYGLKDDRTVRYLVENGADFKSTNALDQCIRNSYIGSATVILDAIEKLDDKQRREVVDLCKGPYKLSGESDHRSEIITILRSLGGNPKVLSSESQGLRGDPQAFDGDSQVSDPSAPGTPEPPPRLRPFVSKQDSNYSAITSGSQGPFVDAPDHQPETPHEEVSGPDDHHTGTQVTHGEPSVGNERSNDRGNDRGEDDGVGFNGRPSPGAWNAHGNGLMP